MKFGYSNEQEVEKFIMSVKEFAFYATFQKNNEWIIIQQSKQNDISVLLALEMK